jgi:hypothetical protein
VHELNHDPRHRVAAGLGTGVVQKNQEQYMAAAWQQVGNVLEGNARIRSGQLAMLTSAVWHRRELGRLATGAGERLLTLTAPLHGRVLLDGRTVAYAVRESTVPAALLGTTARKVLRPRARVTRLTGPSPWTGLVERVNAGEVSAAPAKTVPPNLPTGAGLAGALGGGGPALPPALIALLRQFSAWRAVLWAIAVVLAVVLFFVPGAGYVLAVLVLLAAPWLDRLLRRAIAGGPGPAQVLDPETRTPASVGELPTSSGFATTPQGPGPVRSACPRRTGRGRIRRPDCGSRRPCATCTRWTSPNAVSRSLSAGPLPWTTPSGRRSSRSTR